MGVSSSWLLIIVTCKISFTCLHQTQECDTDAGLGWATAAVIIINPVGDGSACHQRRTWGHLSLSSHFLSIMPSIFSVLFFLVPRPPPALLRANRLFPPAAVISKRQSRGEKNRSRHISNNDNGVSYRLSMGRTRERCSPHHIRSSTPLNFRIKGNGSKPWDGECHTMALSATSGSCVTNTFRVSPT